MNWLLKIIGDITDDVVVVEPLSVNLKTPTIYADSRSAAFYAMGKSIKLSKAVVLLLPGEFLSSTYTAITECWFQKAPVIVIALFEKISDVKTSWMDRCVLSTLTAGSEEEDLVKDFLITNSNNNGPVLLNLVGSMHCIEKRDYSEALKILAGKSVITFNGKDSNSIPYKYKYGVISKYIGSSIIKDSGILLCTSDCVMVDVNVFRTRYANKNMKIAVFDDGALCNNNIDSWIQSNGWNCRTTDKIADLIWLSNEEKQSVLIIREG